ncbi:MAG: hypothetical protein K2W96_14425 [Gemmataceae bacterium]|nr:hypothetical protein [Gemmataceae bacterium]
MPLLDREECIEQAYFFRVLRERLAEGNATQSILKGIDQEILSTTRLPLAIQFLEGELKHTGLLSSGFAKLSHYFTPFQAFVLQGTEEERMRFDVTLGLLVLEREAQYRASSPTPSGLFVYQFEAMCRNRLGYEAGLKAMQGDPAYDDDWKGFLGDVRANVGLIDFAELIFLRSALFTSEKRRIDPEFQPARPALFGEKEGKIARANLGKDPLYLFASLQRQLGYPEVPRPRARDEAAVGIEQMATKLRDLEARLRLLEAEQRGQLTLDKLLDPDKLKSAWDE